MINVIEKMGRQLSGRVELSRGTGMVNVTEKMVRQLSLQVELRSGI